MTVGELVEVLKGLDQNLRVFTEAGCGGYYDADVIYPYEQVFVVDLYDDDMDMYYHDLDDEMYEDTPNKRVRGVVVS